MNHDSWLMRLTNLGRPWGILSLVISLKFWTLKCILDSYQGFEIWNASTVLSASLKLQWQMRPLCYVQASYATARSLNDSMLPVQPHSSLIITSNFKAYVLCSPTHKQQENNKRNRPRVRVIIKKIAKKSIFWDRPINSNEPRFLCKISCDIYPIFRGKYR